MKICGARHGFGLGIEELKKKVDVMHSSPISAPQEIITVLDAKWRFYGKIAMPEVRRFTYNDKSCLSALWLGYRIHELKILLLLQAMIGI